MNPIIFIHHAQIAGLAIINPQKDLRNDVNGIFWLSQDCGLKHQFALIAFSFFICYLAAPRLTLGHWTNNLTHPVLISALFWFQPEGHWKPCNKIVSLCLAKCLVRFEPGTLWLFSQCPDPFGYSFQDKLR